MLKNLTFLFASLLFLLLYSTICFAKQSPSFEQLIAQHQGKIIYLDFWASWCGPCRKSFPWMNEMHKQYQAQGLVIIGVNLDSDKNYADEFLATSPANFTIFFDPEGLVARQYKLQGMPSSFLLNKDGDVISAHVGFNDSKKQKFQQEIVTLLKQK